MKQKAIIIGILFWSIWGTAQSIFKIQNHKQSDKIKFQLINNLIVIPLEVNGVKLSFLLDTGVTKPFIFEVIDTISKHKESEIVYLKGFGEGEAIQAHKTRNNTLRIGNAINNQQDLYAIHIENLDLMSKLGVPIHGIIGFDILKDFVVEINYSKKVLKLINPEFYKPKNTKNEVVLPLEFYSKKPYIDLEIDIDNKRIPVKLLIDTGGSDALWLFENKTEGIQVNNAYFQDFLGHGLSGSVFGKRTKIKGLFMKHFYIQAPHAAFPDTTYIVHATKMKTRSGSISGELLKRFNIVLNYPKALVAFKKNSNFHEPFNYNKSGIELVQDGMRLIREAESNKKTNIGAYKSKSDATSGIQIDLEPQYKLSLKPIFKIDALRENSPAAIAGVKVGDIILQINGRPAHQYNLQKITHLFYADHDKLIKLKVERNGVHLNFNFRLEDPLK